MTKTFVLGLGAQKAGTSWVHGYLLGSPSFGQAIAKEMHVFDCLDVPGMDWRRRQVKRDALADLETADPLPQTARGLLLAAMVAKPGIYYNYFAGLLARDATTVVGDFTPDYALLPAARMQEIGRRFAVRNVRTVGVFLLRDPVERTVSAIRMRQRYNPGELPDDLAEAVLGWHDDPAFSQRSDYAPTLAAVDRAFAAGDAFVGFFEEMFTLASVERLCATVGIEMHAPDLEQRRNAAGGDIALPDNVRRVVARHHASVYEAVATHTGRDVARLWPSAALL